MGRNMLVDGDWKTDVEPYPDEDGAFDRAEASFRDWIRDDPEVTFQPDTDRYHFYRTPGVAETVRMDHIRDHGYFQGEITPVGPDLDYEAPHDRDRLPGERPTSSGV